MNDGRQWEKEDGDGGLDAEYRSPLHGVDRLRDCSSE